MKLLTCILVVISMALASVQAVFASPPEGSCLGIERLDICQDPLLQRNSAAPGDKSSKCFGPFLLQTIDLPQADSANVLAVETADHFCGARPEILLRPPRA